jgi:phage protein D
MINDLGHDREKLLKQMSTIDMSKKHADVLDMVSADKSGTWILSDDGFVCWKNAKISSLLWLSGGVE